MQSQAEPSELSAVTLPVSTGKRSWCYYSLTEWAVSRQGNCSKPVFCSGHLKMTTRSQNKQALLSAARKDPGVACVAVKPQRLDEARDRV